VHNKIKTIYGVAINNQTGNDTLQSVSDAMAANGGKMIGTVEVPLNTTDFSSYLLRVRDAKPDAVLAFVGGGPSSINIVKQFSTQGLKSTITLMGTADLLSEELLPAIGPDAVGVITASNYSVAHKSKLNADFVNVYREVIPNVTPDDVPSFIAVQAFDDLTAMDHAVAQQKGAIDPVKTMDALRGYTFESPRGMITIDAQTREVRENLYILKAVQNKDGKYVNVEIAAYPPAK
jgi:branched-chain amino acid transport system substrate-binding protein